MTSSKGEDMELDRMANIITGDIVTFDASRDETLEGIVTRVWDKPASDPYVTIQTDEDEPRTFVRSQSAVVMWGHTGASPAEYAAIVAAERTGA